MHDPLIRLISKYVKLTDDDIALYRELFEPVLYPRNRIMHSDLNVECITDCELLRISRPNLDRLQQESSKMKDFSIAIFEQSLAYNERRSRDLATLTAEQRYQKLLKEHPDLLHHVPLQYIASFLGMKPESLSRIRRQIIS